MVGGLLELSKYTSEEALRGRLRRPELVPPTGVRLLRALLLGLVPLQERSVHLADEEDEVRLFLVVESL